MEFDRHWELIWWSPTDESDSGIDIYYTKEEADWARFQKKQDGYRTELNVIMA
jgi:hypothetical protein